MSNEYSLLKRFEQKRPVKFLIASVVWWVVVHYGQVNEWMLLLNLKRFELLQNIQIAL